MNGKSSTAKIYFNTIRKDIFQDKLLNVMQLK